MTTLLTTEQITFTDRRVAMRVDMNVPIYNGSLIDDQRIRACLPDIKAILETGGALILISHLGRPEPGLSDLKYSLQPIASHLSELLNKNVTLVPDYLNGVSVRPGELVMCENIRFQSGELKDDDTLATQLANLCDIYVMNAFGCAHRPHASTHKAILYAKTACAGILFAREVEEISKVSGDHRSDYPDYLHRIAIVGGSKVSGKLELLAMLSEQVDTLIIGGGIANTFIVGMGYDIGRSLYEKELVSFSIELRNKMKMQNKRLLLPFDVLCSKELSERSNSVCKTVDRIQADEMILDIGPETQTAINEAILGADFVLWNGPLGAFEYTPFADGTRAMIQSIERSSTHIVAGGGDTLAAIKKFGMQKSDIHISTGGGAFLQLISGRELPALTALNRKAQNNESITLEH